jgi:hypothetical protein
MGRGSGARRCHGHGGAQAGAPILRAFPCPKYAPRPNSTHSRRICIHLTPKVQPARLVIVTGGSEYAR